MCIAGTLHDGGNVCKIQIDVAFLHDQVGNALDTGLENVIGQRKGLLHGQRLVNTNQKLFVGDHDQRIHILHQLINTTLSLCHFLLALEQEGLGNNRNGQNVHLLGDLCNHRSRTGTGTAAHACGDEYHIRTLQRICNLVLVFLSGTLSYIRLVAGTTAPGQLCTDLDLGSSLGIVQRLCVRIHCNIFNVLDAGIDHTVQRIAAAAANADHLNIHLRVECFLVDKVSHLKVLLCLFT